MAPTSKPGYGICNSPTGLWPHFSSHFRESVQMTRFQILIFFRTSQNPSQITTKKPYWILFHGGHNPQWISIFFMVKLFKLPYSRYTKIISPYLPQLPRVGAEPQQGIPHGREEWGLEPSLCGKILEINIWYAEIPVYIYTFYMWSIKQSINQSNQIKSNQAIYIIIYTHTRIYNYIWLYLYIYDIIWLYMSIFMHISF